MKRRLITASLLAFLASGSAAVAQSDPGRVTGIVTSLEGNLPLTGVRVLVVGSPASVTTNSLGRYTLTLSPGLYRLRVSAIPSRVLVGPDDQAGGRSAYGGATSASYTTPVTVAGDNGALFSVMVTNVAGTATSSNATLTVNTAPVITIQPVNQSGAVGATATCRSGPFLRRPNDGGHSRPLHHGSSWRASFCLANS